jgi:hypothetical protein
VVLPLNDDEIFTSHKNKVFCHSKQAALHMIVARTSKNDKAKKQTGLYQYVL